MKANKVMTTEINDGLLRLEYEVEGVTEKTLMFGLCYLPPSAQRRHNRSGMPLAWQIQNHSTPSCCRYEPLYRNREDAQFRCDTRNASEFGGEKYLHVIERWAVPVADRKPFAPSCCDDLDSKDRVRYDEAVQEACRDFDGKDLDAELKNINRDFFV